MFELGHNLIESPTTEDLLVWEDGTVVQPGSIDYDANSFDYTSSGAVTDLDIFYIARNPASVEIRKTGPGAGAKVNQMLKEAQTETIHTRDQAQHRIGHRVRGRRQREILAGPRRSCSRRY
ncbi:hypothetical protein JMJ58_21175 (plasmid) [Haloterrigena salifodinae]|uniref:Uncharacterized protein n=1 Tax=Haloterrigena salifodinae TaxID=2675099 RepID=A0A8T8E6X8_9EURY|nr:hypothetical protein [Haloterrigena salifodinae]QRV17469.1 hypothetical protein JMJ58_21175 [Haloterrigena salifodinae]